MFASIGEMVSWTKVLKGKDNDATSGGAATSPTGGADSNDASNGAWKPGIPAWVLSAEDAQTDGVDTSGRASA
jgi:hypothetical protein